MSHEGQTVRVPRSTGTVDVGLGGKDKSTLKVHPRVKQACRRSNMKEKRSFGAVGLGLTRDGVYEIAKFHFEEHESH